MDSDIKREKRHLKGKALIAFIAFLCSFIPMSTDLYLPALPSMAGTASGVSGRAIKASPP